MPYFGSLAGLAVIKTVQENEQYITENALIKELRGLKQPLFVQFEQNEYTGKMNPIKKEEFHDVVKSFI